MKDDWKKAMVGSQVRALEIKIFRLLCGAAAFVWGVNLARWLR